MIEARVETLDVRDMVPRERHPAIFARLDALKPGQSLRLINDHNPAPLHYQLIAERPKLFTWEPEMQGPETWIVYIRRSETQEQTPARATQETSSESKGSKTILPTQPLRDEHQELLPQIAVLRTVADSIGAAKDASVRQSVQEVSQFLTRHLLPHAQAEERVLYPVVGKLLGAPAATATMRRDHAAIRQRTQELGEIQAHLEKTGMSEELEMALRRVLYGLFTLLTVHIAKEEEIYLPILDARLSPEEAQHLFAEMEQAAHEAKSAGE